MSDGMPSPPPMTASRLDNNVTLRPSMTRHSRAVLGQAPLLREVPAALCLHDAKLVDSLLHHHPHLSGPAAPGHRQEDRGHRRLPAEAQVVGPPLLKAPPLALIPGLVEP
eukprot:scaffold41338_cov39-Prasinocladus_malaysianus.AAC.1